MSLVSGKIEFTVLELPGGAPEPDDPTPPEPVEIRTERVGQLTNPGGTWDGSVWTANIDSYVDLYPEPALGPPSRAGEFIYINMVVDSDIWNDVDPETDVSFNVPVQLAGYKRLGSILMASWVYLDNGVNPAVQIQIPLPSEPSLGSTATFLYSAMDPKFPGSTVTVSSPIQVVTEGQPSPAVYSDNLGPPNGSIREFVVEFISSSAAEHSCWTQEELPHAGIYPDNFTPSVNYNLGTITYFPPSLMPGSYLYVGSFGQDNDTGIVSTIRVRDRVGEYSFGDPAKTTSDIQVVNVELT